MTPPPTGTLEVATLGPFGACAFDADGLAEVASAAGDEEAGSDVAGSAGVVDGAPLVDSAAHPARAVTPAPAKATTPAARSTVRRVVPEASSTGSIVDISCLRECRCSFDRRRDRGRSGSMCLLVSWQRVPAESL